ncbi:DNA replication/repair protein RecF [uncultured Tessaracoccus sp.]|uniref:DNA replication/repair protein RecF n=1 Tax=uncultured Tessaracoccus sp. TaxID=905023 RepID=UPI0025F270E5|nr:DNA replication/repair protein RecF [uncultured Tessaracoccus sp.]
MYLTTLELTDFRNYTEATLELTSGVTVFVGSNGQGKTNLVEAVEYLSTAQSHRVSSIAPLIRAGEEQALVRARVRAGLDDPREVLLELEIARGRQNQARLNRGPLPRARDLVGMLRTVVFSPMDLAIVRGDPADRRRWIDSLVVTRWPRMAGVKQDYDKALRQRNALLKQLGARRDVAGDDELTLQVWNDQLSTIGAELLHARLDTLADVRPFAQRAYERIAPRNNRVDATYRSGVDLEGASDADDVRAELRNRLSAALDRVHDEELRRGVTLVGPQRDDVDLGIGELPAKGYASHGESWSLALALRLGGFELVRDDGIEPVLVLDDVFAELDVTRRERLADAIRDAEQVFITAAVGSDVPEFTAERRFRVDAGTVHTEEDAA